MYVPKYFSLAYVVAKAIILFLYSVYVCGCCVVIGWLGGRYTLITVSIDVRRHSTL